MGLELLCGGDVGNRLLGLGTRRCWAPSLPLVFVLMLRSVDGVLGVLSFRFGGVLGPLGPLHAVLFLGIVVAEFFATADVFSLSLICECVVLR